MTPNSFASQEPIEIYVKGNRFRVPVEFAMPRTSLVLTAGPGPCLLLFQPQKWDPIRDKLLSYPVLEDPAEQAKIKALLRVMVGNARDVRVSARNMIGIDEELATYADIQGRLLLAPSSKAIELWNPAKFDPTNRLKLFAKND